MVIVPLALTTGRHYRIHRATGNGNRSLRVKDVSISNSAMSDQPHVQESKRKPLFVYDGDCGFCRAWITRWQASTGDRVDYAPYQEVADDHPDISRAAFESAAQLIDVDGQVYAGAAAVIRALDYARGKRWMRRAYDHLPGARFVCDHTYRLVAGHRRSLSWITRLLWGDVTEPTTFVHTRRWFLRLLGVVYFVAFLSLGVQVLGLIGQNGIMPAAEYLDWVGERLGDGRYWRAPTLCWFDASDQTLQWMCYGGAGLSALLVLGVTPLPITILLWAMYLSLVTVGSVFMHFQWDILLLETGFLAIFLAPPRLRLQRADSAPPSRIMILLVRWLLFRLMFQSGVVKLTSGDVSWADLSALTLHYETQPLPIWTSWYAHQLPLWMHQVSCVAMFAIELVVPFMLFAPRRVRHLACLLIAGLMFTIAATGNYTFFNLCTLVLCVGALDDSVLRRLNPFTRRGDSIQTTTTPRRFRLRNVVIVPVALIIALVSTVQGVRNIWGRDAVPAEVVRYTAYAGPFKSISSYGLFRVMTKTRPEVIIEGSNDRRTWLEYEFWWKPGDVNRPPGLVQPHQPRVDWQMWFAALGHHQRNPWLIRMMRRTLEGSPDVLAFYRHNPFPDAPPRYIRAVRYQYHFTDRETRRETDAWWRRDQRRIYSPILDARN